MTETLNGKQVLALLAQDEVPEIEAMNMAGEWYIPCLMSWDIASLLCTKINFRIKPTPQRRLSVTLANGEVVSWPEPVREASKLKEDQEYWFVDDQGDALPALWDNWAVDHNRLLAFGNVYLTREAAQEHADALRKINMQEVGK